MAPVLPRTTIVGANGDGGAEVEIFEIEIVEEGIRDGGTVEEMIGRLVGVVADDVEIDTGPLVRVNCVTGTDVEGESSMKMFFLYFSFWFYCL